MQWSNCKIRVRGTLPPFPFSPSLSFFITPSFPWFRDFSLPGIFAPQSESSHWEHSLPGTKVTGNFRYRERMFPGPVAWNSLPASIRELTSTNSFKRQLKTHLFRVAYEPAVWLFLCFNRFYVLSYCKVPLAELYFVKGATEVLWWWWWWSVTTLLFMPWWTVIYIFSHLFSRGGGVHCINAFLSFFFSFSLVCIVLFSCVHGLRACYWIKWMNEWISPK